MKRVVEMLFLGGGAEVGGRQYSSLFQNFRIFRITSV